MDYWAYKWSDLLLVSSRKLNSTAMWSFYDWIRDSVKQNKPWNQFASEIFLTSGSTRQNGALNYFVLHKDPIELSENATQAFLGQRITCARCHNHPLEKWTQTQYYEMANLFARVGVKNGSQAGENIIFAKASGDVLHPRLGKPLPPTPLDAQGIPIDSPVDRRTVFAKWLTSPQNPMFARTIVNRVWGNFMGRGIGRSRGRSARHESGVERGAARGALEGLRRARLRRAATDPAHHELERLPAFERRQCHEPGGQHLLLQVHRAAAIGGSAARRDVAVTGAPTAFPGYPAGTRALQLPDTQVKSEFLTSFGRPPRLLCDAAERSSVPTVAQALHVINGDTLNKKLSAPEGTIALFLKLGLSDRRILEYMFLSAFSRYPTDQERQTLGAALEQARLTTGTEEARRESHRQAIEDMVWAMLTSKEFLFNH